MTFFFLSFDGVAVEKSSSSIFKCSAVSIVLELVAGLECDTLNKIGLNDVTVLNDVNVNNVNSSFILTFSVERFQWHYYCRVSYDLIREK